APPVDAPGYATTRKPAHDDDDVALARRVVSGDISAFERLLRRFNQPLYRVARAIVKDEAEAEDVLQEAMLRAYRSMSSFRDDAHQPRGQARIAAKRGHRPV